MLAILFNEPSTIVVPAGSPFRDVRDIIEKLKRDPQSVSIAIGFAPGGINHLAAALLFEQGGVDVKKLKRIAAIYKQFRGALTDVGLVKE
jgi:putative tricarboxylic transport membrane protein